MTSETIKVLNERVSVRSFTDAPLSDDTVDEILRAAFRAPTSSNIQSYSVIVVRDQATKEKIATIAGGQKHVVQCPVFLAFCADLTRIEYALKKNGHDLDNNNLEMGLVSSVDAALVGMSAYLAADSLGVKGVMIGAVRNDALATAQALGLPHRVYCVFGLCLGFAESVPGQKPRMHYDAVVHREQYNSNKTVQRVTDYDEVLAAHYRSQAKVTADDSWTHEVATKFSVRPREVLREALRQRGFDFS
ncbi:MAG: NADPH-dependent oxidoreductase [Gammaproteobacteria bacterium]|nr:NADPH-dependent oxidoreductase [Gammaproteobacteria bacterium]